MLNDQAIKQFFQSEAYAVIGASKNPEKYGNKIVKAYIDNNLKVYPVNPQETEIHGLPVIADVKSLPTSIKSISVVTPAIVTEKILAYCVEQGIANVWLQPGSYTSEQYDKYRKLLNVIADGACILVWFSLNPHKA